MHALNQYVDLASMVAERIAEQNLIIVFRLVRELKDPIKVILDFLLEPILQ